MKESLQRLMKQAKEEITLAKDLKDLEALRVKYLGKKGELTAILKNMKDLSQDMRPVIGKIANDVREEIEGQLENAKESKIGRAHV